tara:strand:- start:4711 stop:5598 length:888 start_codon:yes stop_codon:yes gene_type:complete
MRGASKYGPLKQGHVREDGAVFIAYKTRGVTRKRDARIPINSSIYPEFFKAGAPQVSEVWGTQDKFKKVKERKNKVNKKIYHEKYKHDPEHKERQRKYQREYWKNASPEAKEKHKNKCRKWQRANPKKVKAWLKAWKEKNPEKIAEYSNNYDRNEYYRKNAEKIKKDRRDRYHSDPAFKMIIVQRNRIKRFLAMTNIKQLSKTDELLGCSPQELIDHLKSQFKPGMTLENHGKGKGKWNVDHIIPLDFFKKNFDLTDLEVQKKAFHYTNLQPMWGDENIIKSNKLPPQVKKVELN